MVVHPDSIPCFPASRLRFALMIGMTEKFGMHNWHSSDAQLLEAKVPVARAALHWPSVGIPGTRLWRVFAPSEGGHKRPQGSYIMFFFKMLLGAWCLVSLVRIETMACHGVKAHCWLADRIYHRNHGLFVSCYVKSV